VPVARSTKLQILKRRRLVARLYLRKMTQQQIADKIGIERSTISRDLKYLRNLWRKEAISDIDERRGRELAELEEMERDAIQNYTLAKESKDIDGIVTKEKDNRSMLAWFRSRLEVKFRIDKLLGLSAPDKLTVLDWREEFKKAGMNESDENKIFEEMVKRHIADTRQSQSADDDRGEEGSGEKAE